MKLVDGCCCGRDRQTTESANGSNCPICNNEGTAVSRVTVEHLVNADNRTDVRGDGYRVCMNENCNVVYYNLNHATTFFKDQVGVPVWFKKDANPKYACYCSKVTEEQVAEAVVVHGAKTVNEVNTITGAMKNPHCEENNPLGVCCHKALQKAIDKALAKK